MPVGVYKRTPEANAATLAGRMASPKWRAAITNKAKIRKMHEAAWKSEKRMKAFHLNRKKSHKSPIWLAAIRAALIRNRRCIRRRSKPQMSLFRYLCRMGIRGIKLEYSVASYRADIAFPEKKRCIEVDGIYWHKINKTDYAKRDKIFESLGWEILRLPFPFTPSAFHDACDFFEAK